LYEGIKLIFALFAAIFALVISILTNIKGDNGVGESGRQSASVVFAILVAIFAGLAARYAHLGATLEATYSLNVINLKFFKQFEKNIELQESNISREPVSRPILENATDML
jgi:hypothetical protein